MSYKLAVFSIIQNEDRWPEHWIKHYLNHTSPECIFLLDHDSADIYRDNYKKLEDHYGINVLRVSHETTHHHGWLSETASKFQHFLLNSFDATLYTDIDEFVLVDPSSQFTTLTDFAEYNLHGSRTKIRTTGYEIVHNIEKEEPIDFERPLLEQRKWWYHSDMYSKPLLANEPIWWNVGFHALATGAQEVIDRELLLLHLHRLDFDYAAEKHERVANMNWSQADIAMGFGVHNRITDRRELLIWWYNNVDYDQPGTHRRIEFAEIPSNIRQLL
jgi:hypothetical protein